MVRMSAPVGGFEPQQPEMLEAPEAADDDEAGPVGPPETVIPGQVGEPPGDRRFVGQVLGDRSQQEPAGGPEDGQPGDPAVVARGIDLEAVDDRVGPGREGDDLERGDVGHDGESLRRGGAWWRPAAPGASAAGPGDQDRRGGPPGAAGEARPQRASAAREWAETFPVDGTQPPGLVGTCRSRRSRGRSHSDGGKSQATPKPRSAGRGPSGASPDRPWRIDRPASGRWRRSGSAAGRGPRRVGRSRDSSRPARRRRWRGGGDQPRHGRGRLLPSLAGAMSGPLSPTPTRPRAEPLDRCEEHRRSGGTAVVDRSPDRSARTDVRRCRVALRPGARRRPARR